MQHTTRPHFLILWFVLSLPLILVISLYAGRMFTVFQSGPFQDEARSLSDQWYYVENGYQAEIPTLPTKLETGDLSGIRIQRVLPEKLPNAGTLFLETYHQSVQVWLDANLLYEYGVQDNAPIGRILGNVAHTINLPDGAEGGLLTVQLSSPYATGTWFLSDVRLGSAGAILGELVKSCMNTGIFVLLFSILGLVLLASAIVLHRKWLELDLKSIVYLGCFFLLSTIWVLTDSRLGQYVIPNHATLYLLSFFSFTLMPVPFLLFLRQVCNHGKRLLEVLTAFFLLQLLLCMVLYLSGLADLVATLPITHVLMLLTILSSLILCLQERYRYHVTDTRYITIGICLLMLGGLVALLTFRPQMSRDNSEFFRYGLIGFFLCLGYSTVKRSLSMFHASMKAEIYHTLAFTDTLTGLLNRAAFDRDSDHLALETSDARYTLIMIDINHLKQVNDAYGHQVGDRLIAGAGHCIQTIFAEHATCYRIGGDEFAVLLPNEDISVIDHLLHQLDEEAARYDLGIPECLQMAKGYASGKVGSPLLIRTLIHEADARMYQEKGHRIQPVTVLQSP